MLGLATIKNIIMHICVNICVIKGHQSIHMKTFVKYLDTFYFNFNNYFLIIEILIKILYQKNNIENSFVDIV